MHYEGLARDVDADKLDRFIPHWVRVEEGPGICEDNRPRLISQMI
jgi:hypothetical protein